MYLTYKLVSMFTSSEYRNSLVAWQIYWNLTSASERLMYVQFTLEPDFKREVFVEIAVLKIQTILRIMSILRWSFSLKMQTNQSLFTEAELRSRILLQLFEIILLSLFSGTPTESLHFMKLSHEEHCKSTLLTQTFFLGTPYFNSYLYWDC